MLNPVKAPQKLIQRKAYIDIAKGLVVLLMIAAHILYSFPDNRLASMTINIIYAFHIPFFFIITGIMKKIKANLLIVHNK